MCSVRQHLKMIRIKVDYEIIEPAEQFEIGIGVGAQFNFGTDINFIARPTFNRYRSTWRAHQRKRATVTKPPRLMPADRPDDCRGRTYLNFFLLNYCE